MSRYIIPVFLIIMTFYGLTAFEVSWRNPQVKVCDYSHVNRDQDPPTNLTAIVSNFNDVTLNWQEPGSGNILWDQLDAEGETYGKSAQDFEPVYNAYDAEVAGDFVLENPATVTGCAVNFFFNAAYSEAVPFNVGFFPDEDGEPGETALVSIFTAEYLPNENNVYEITFAEPVELPAGTYWIGYNMKLDYGTLEIQCFANQKVSLINGTPAYWRNPGDGFGTGYTTWSPAVLSQGNTPEDITFSIIGEYNTTERELIGYNIYRNYELLNQNPLSSLTYQDEGLNAGVFAYQVTAYYDDGESEPTSPVEVEIILGSPQNFTAVSLNYNVLCQWSPPQPSRNITGYHVYRDGSEIALVNNLFYVDQNVPSGTYTYYATTAFAEYESEPSNSVTVEHTAVNNDIVSFRTELTGNYPNPFNPSTMICYTLKNSGQVKLEIYNLKGYKIRDLTDEYKEAGEHAIIWDGKDNRQQEVTSGIYLYQLRTGRFTSTKKMILMK
ncbi:MAG: T9SS type A sorting domain-containing protein [Candidatus Cloacimonetes bacterium]|nr:T9SS type A sorting domain-containing protein [Candidatus Cloacimonadota bacterium]